VCPLLLKESDSMQPRSWSKMLSWLFVFAVASSCGLGWSEEQPWNVLLIVCDDLNSHVGPAGYQAIQTPTLDSLAKQSLRLNRAYCQYPVCGPSRASFLTGRYPETTRILDNKLDLRKEQPQLVTLPELFKKNGYWTAGVGKIFHGQMNYGERAWHEFTFFNKNKRNPVEEKLKREFVTKHGAIETPQDERAFRRYYREHKPPGSAPLFGPTDMTDQEHRDGMNVRRIEEWLDKRAYGDQPFFIACGIHKPHVPFYAPEKYFTKYPQQQLPIAVVKPDDLNDIPRLALNHRYQGFGFELGKHDEVRSRQYMQAYHACISFVDAQIDYLLKAVKRNNLWDRTIVVFTSDHGYHLGEHFMWGKVTLFEECAHVPLLVRVPGLTADGTEHQGLVQLLDLYPTLADLCQMPLPAGIQGHSIRPLLEGKDVAVNPVAYTVVTRGNAMKRFLGKSIRTDRWRYAEWDDPDQNELYDLRQDPQEYVNLAKKEEHQQDVQRLRRLLRKQEKIAAAK